VARSSTEIKYRRLAETIAEILWIQALLKELGITHDPPSIYCDNQSAVT